MRKIPNPIPEHLKGKPKPNPPPAPPPKIGSYAGPTQTESKIIDRLDRIIELLQ